MKNVQVLGINITVCLVVSLYLLYLTYLDYTSSTNKLPGFVRTLMGSFIVRLALLVLIAATALGYNKLGGLHVAVLMAAAYLLTMSMVHKDQITENFVERLTNPEEKEQMTNNDNSGGDDDYSPDSANVKMAETACKDIYEKCTPDTNVPDDVAAVCTKLQQGVNEKDSSKIKDAFQTMMKADGFGNTCKDGSSAKPSDSQRKLNQAISEITGGLQTAVDKCNQQKGESSDSACDDLKSGIIDLNKAITGVTFDKKDTQENFTLDDTYSVNDNGPIGKAFRETMGAEPKCNPYSSLDDAFATPFNPQPHRQRDSVFASGYPDPLPAAGANFSSNPPGPYATNGVAYQMEQA